MRGNRSDRREGALPILDLVREAEAERGRDDDPLGMNGGVRADARDTIADVDATRARTECLDDAGARVAGRQQVVEARPDGSLAARTPSVRAFSITLRAWSGRSRALPSRLFAAVSATACSVPAEISDQVVRTRTSFPRGIGSGPSIDLEVARAEILDELAHSSDGAIQLPTCGLSARPYRSTMASAARAAARPSQPSGVAGRGSSASRGSSSLEASARPRRPTRELDWFPP